MVEGVEDVYILCGRVCDLDSGGAERGGIVISETDF